MNKRGFTQEELKTLYPDFPFGTRSSYLYDTTRWGDIYETIFEVDGKFWRAYFEIGSGDSDYTYWDDYNEIEATEVKAMQVLVTQWFEVE